MALIEQKYIQLISSRLRNYKMKSQYLWNFSCPICGDSEKNKAKARGYIYQKKGKYIFHCHNCSATLSLQNFIKKIDPMVYNDFVREYLQENGLSKPTPVAEFAQKMKPPAFLKDDSPLKKLKKISQLNSEHPAKQYIASRQIPTDCHRKLFYCPHFKKWVNTIIPGKFQDTSTDDDRIILPFLDEKNILFGFQGRSLDPNAKVRYITIMIDEERPRFFGLDSIDYTKPVYVFEGPIDSLFIPNSIASAGGDITSELAKLGVDKSVFTIVYDNEPRNADTVKKINKAILCDYKVCIWLPSVGEKDINDMVKAILSKQNKQFVDTERIKKIGCTIKKIIDNNTFAGLEAQMNLSQWKKVK